MCFESSFAVDERVNPILSGSFRKRKIMPGKIPGTPDRNPQTWGAMATRAEPA